MVASTVIETRDQVWSPVIDRLAAPALDCVQTGLAALADHHHGEGTHLALGARLGFATSAVPGRPPTVEVPVERHLALAGELAGLRVAQRRDRLDGSGLRRFAGEAGLLYVLADAFDMAWTPYGGQVHMEHSFLLLPADDRYLVVDAYHNETEWGVARPGVWRLSTADLDASLGGGVSAMVVTAAPRPVVDPVALLAGNASAMAAARPEVVRYVAAVRAGIDGTDHSAARRAAVDQLVLDVWLLSRSRQLHAIWLAAVRGFPATVPATAHAQAREWQRLASQSYLGMRRARQGAAIPPSVVQRLEELLHSDVDLAARLAAATAPDAEIREAVAHAVRLVLRLDTVDAEPSRPLRSLPNFNSFRLVDIIERIESRLGVELDAEDLTLEALHDVDSLSRLFARAVGGAHR